MTKATIDVRRKDVQASEIDRPKSKSGNDKISLELVTKMVEWDKERKTLEHWQWNTLKLSLVFELHSALMSISAKVLLWTMSVLRI